MRFTLIIEDSDGVVADEYSFEEGEFIVGRSHSGDIILPSDNVSRRHARLFTQNGRCYVEDMNSSNGVFVNGQRIHRPFEIVGAAQIKVGDYYLHIEAGDGAPAPAPVHGQAPAGYPPTPQQDVDAIYGRLVGTSEPVLGQPYDLVRSVTLVGRGKDCAITIIDPSMSRVHGKIGRDADYNLFVEDLRSSNGTYVNDTRIAREALEHGDRVRFGNVEFILELPGMGDAEVVEVSSGGRKGLIFLIVFLVLLLIGGGVTLFLYKDAIFGGAEVAEGESEAERAERKAKEERERQARFDEAEGELDDIIDRAEKFALQDQWDDAKKALVEGAELLKKIGRLDEKGELNQRFETFEAELRAARQEYDTFLDALAESKYAEAGLAYQRLVKRGGAMKDMASRTLTAKKTELTAAGDALCAAKSWEQCLAFYQKAKMLDPTDAEIGKKVAQTRTQMQAPTPAPEAPAPEAPAPEAPAPEAPAPEAPAP